MEKIIGLIDAPFTPFHENGEVNLEPIGAYAAMLAKNGLKGVFINGSSGEGYMLTEEERMQLATATLLGGCATTAAAIVIAIVLCLLFCSCTTTRYIPVNETRTEHHWHTDSVHQTDTIINRETTVIRELDSAAMTRYGIQIGAMQRAWLVQSDRLQREVARLETLSQQRDTVRDSIPKPYPVEVIKQVPRDLTLWQRIRQSVGDFAILLLLIFVGCKIFVKFLPDFHNPNSKE